MAAESRTAAEGASAFRARHGLGDAPIRDIIQVVEDFCAAFVISRPFPSALDAFTVQDGVAGITIIAVGTSENYERQRFTIAHELGHLESGRMSADIHGMDGYQRNPDEVWADNFARHILLPLSAVESYLTDTDRTRGALPVESLSDLVRVFGISPKAAMIQLRDSGWISTATFEEWQASHMTTSKGLALRHGWSSEREAMVRSSLTQRRPTRLVQAATTAYQANAVSLAALAQTSGENDLDHFRAVLDETGIRPAEVAKRLDDWEPDDLSDLYRNDD